MPKQKTSALLHIYFGALQFHSLDHLKPQRSAHCRLGPRKESGPAVAVAVKSFGYDLTSHCFSNSVLFLCPLNISQSREHPHSIKT